CIIERLAELLVPLISQAAFILDKWVYVVRVKRFAITENRSSCVLGITSNEIYREAFVHGDRTSVAGNYVLQGVTLWGCESIGPIHCNHNMSFYWTVNWTKMFVTNNLIAPSFVDEVSSKRDGCARYKDYGQCNARFQTSTHDTGP